MSFEQMKPQKGPFTACHAQPFIADAIGAPKNRRRELLSAWVPAEAGIEYVVREIEPKDGYTFRRGGPEGHVILNLDVFVKIAVGPASQMQKALKAIAKHPARIVLSEEYLRERRGGTVSESDLRLLIDGKPHSLAEAEKVGMIALVPQPKTRQSSRSVAFDILKWPIDDLMIISIT